MQIIISSRLTDQQNSLFKQSHLAYCTVENEVQPMIERDAAVRDGYVVSELDEDNPDDCLDLQIDHESDKARALVERRVAAIRRKSFRAQTNCGFYYSNILYSQLPNIRIFFFSIGIDEISIILWLYKMFL